MGYLTIFVIYESNLYLHEEKDVEEAQKYHHGVKDDPVHGIGLVKPVISTWKQKLSYSFILHNLN